MLAWFRHVARVGAIGALALATVSSCGKTTSGVQGISCTQASDCNAGLQCLPFYSTGDGGEDAGCAQYGSVCFQSCTTSTDCTEPDYVCMPQCEGARVCMPDYGGSAVPDAAVDGVSDSPADAVGQ